MSSASSPLGRAARILDTLAAAPAGLPFNEIARRVELPAASTHRLLRNLVDIGFAEGGGGRAPYRLGSRLLRLLQFAIAPACLESLVLPLLEPLATRFNQVSFLVRLLDRRLELAATVIPRRAHGGTYAHPGQACPMHATAAGKLILAHQPAELFDAVVGAGLEPYTAHTVTDPDILRAHVEEARERGYAVCDEELDPDIYAVACPVAAGSAGVVYSVGLLGLKARFFEERPLPEYVRALQEAADSLGRVLAAPPR